MQSHLVSYWTGQQVYDFRDELRRMGWHDAEVYRYGTVWEGIIVQGSAPVDFNDISDVRGLFSGIARKWFGWVSDDPSENQIWLDSGPRISSGNESVQSGAAKTATEVVTSVADTAGKGASNNVGMIALIFVLFIAYRRFQDN